MFNPLQKVADARRAKAAAARAQDQAAQSGNESAKTLGKNEKFLIHDFNGVLKSGEMALVVGRPGAGCTTFLKVSERNRGFVNICLRRPDTMLSL
jgi:ATP-binding cassette, subfamily G (WHITE), member 2, SNQ2